MAALVEQAFTVIALLLYSGVIGPFIGETNALAPAKEVLAITGFLITSCLLLRNWKQVLFVAKRDFLLWLLIAFAAFSVLWSDYLWVSLDKVFALIRVTAFGVYFASRYTINEQAKLLSWVFAIGAVMSLIIATFLPYYGVMGAGLVITGELVKHAGVWRGAYIHKVVLGTMMAFGTLVFFCRYEQDRGKSRRWLMGAGIILCLSLLIKSTTKAALMGLIAILILIPFYRALRWRYSLAIPFFCIAIVVGAVTVALFATNLDTIMGAFGRDATLSGRTDYWTIILHKVMERPWLGYGYGAFWHGGWKGEPGGIWKQLSRGNEPPHAHNGLLNLWLELGLVTLTIFVLSYVRACVRAVRWLRNVKTPDGLVPLCFLTFLFLINITESLLVNPEVPWLLYVSTTLSIHNRRELVQPVPINHLDNCCKV